jgi:hypothetical protein
MKQLLHTPYLLQYIIPLLTFLSCHEKKSSPSLEAVAALNLKRGEIVSCGSPGKVFGAVAFETSCTGKVKNDVDLAISLLHSFEYDEAEKAFARVIDQEPGCAMAYWGVAMSNYHPLWAPPTPAELEKGSAAIKIARSLPSKSSRESDYINSIALFYKDWDKTSHAARCNDFEKAMEKLYTKYPKDKEAAIFYALALTGTADPADKSFARQKRAGEILNTLSRSDAGHPGIIHYIIHSYDYPELAALALPAAKRYASIAPSSAHALHMPSHIFVRLGLWDDCINSNLAAASAAKCYAENTGIKGHWDEELHAMDYLVYAYLQQGDNALAKKQWDYLNTIREVNPPNFKVAYAFAAIPSRYLLENKRWKEAAALEASPVNLSWEKFPWQKAIIHFTRALGCINTGNAGSARAELKKLGVIYDTLMQQNDVYKANQVHIQVKTAEAWLLFKEGKINDAIKTMTTAANLEDNTQKMAVTPGEVLPARELLGDMLMQANQPAAALAAYEADLQQHQGRFNGLYGAALAAEKSGNVQKATYYYQQLAKVARPATTGRPELAVAKAFLKIPN